MLALERVLFLRQKQVSEVNARAERGSHLVRDVGAVHRGQAVLRFKLLQLLRVSHILHKDEDGVASLVVDVLDALRKDFLRFNPH